MYVYMFIYISFLLPNNLCTTKQQSIFTYHECLPLHFFSFHSQKAFLPHSFLILPSSPKPQRSLTNYIQPILTQH